MKRYLIFLGLIGSIIALIASCKKEKYEDVRSFQRTPYQLVVPTGFPQPYNTYPDSLTVEGVRLGRMLYYDPILSSNGLSCSSCHIRAKSFSAPLHIHPNGEQNSVPQHLNLAWKKSFLWEGGLPSIETVCMGDFEPEFFNTNMSDLVKRLTTHNQYPRLFYEAFYTSDLSKLTHTELKQEIVTAISQFIRTMVSSDSKFDQYKRYQYNPTMDEIRGMIIFNTEEGDCFHCHGSILATDNNLHNNGLDESPTGANMGYYNFSHDAHDIGKFLAPSLRNVELTAPYMHDGRFATLEEVVDFYDHGVHLSSPNVDPIMTKPAKVFGLNLSAYDKNCLVAFLKMFTDSAFINNPDYKNPF